MNELDGESKRITMIVICVATAMAIFLLQACAAYKSTLETSTIYDMGEPSERVELAKLRTLGVKTVFVSVAKDEQSSRFAADVAGSFEMRTGGSGEVFDGVTGPVKSLDTLGSVAIEVAPYASQYMMARQAAKAAAEKIAETITTPSASQAVSP